MSQFATSRFQHGGRRKLPFVFTEHGAIMAANVLNSRRAIQMSVFVVRAFVKMTETLAMNKSLNEKLDELQKKLTTRLHMHDKAILRILWEIKKLKSTPEIPEPERKSIGFRVEESSLRYRIK
jgi:hypothetical protein